MVILISHNAAIPQMGTHLPGIVYEERASVYGLATDHEGRILACRRGGDRVVLPGGGLEEEEGEEDALCREVAEETGYRVLAARSLCRAWQYHNHRLDKPPVNKRCHFFVMEVAGRPSSPAEADHVPGWFDSRELISSLTYESHRWAVTVLRGMVTPP
ncbi:MAG: NUDIX domain-containing protein [bacterium]|nr:NUDIX domain-containing protein [bacterium]